MTSDLMPLEFESEFTGAVDVTERHGRRGELWYQAAEDGVDPVLMVAWAETTKESP